MADQRIKAEYHGSSSVNQGQHSQAPIKKRHGHRQMKLSESYHPDYRKRGGH